MTRWVAPIVVLFCSIISAGGGFLFANRTLPPLQLTTTPAQEKLTVHIEQWGGETVSGTTSTPATVLAGNKSANTNTDGKFSLAGIGESDTLAVFNEQFDLTIVPPKATTQQETTTPAAPESVGTKNSTQQPTTAPYVASKRGKKFYATGSSGAANLKKENLIYFATWDAALKAGYTPSSGLEKP